MYCRNCGSEMSENAAVCVACGVAKGESSNYCPNCGSETNPQAVVCIKCGVALSNKANKVDGIGNSEKSKTVAGVLAIFLGFFGIHEFYLGNNKKAIIRIIATAIAFILIKAFDSMVANLAGYGFLSTIGWLVLLTVAILNICDAVKIFKGKATDANGNELK